MLQQDRVHALRQTHSAVSTLMPIITAGLTVTGAVIAAIEARRASASAAEAAAADPNGAASGSESAPATTPLARSRRARGFGVRHYIATLAARLLMVLLGIAIVLAITFAATSTGRVGAAITITALILITLYLVEKAARRG